MFFLCVYFFFVQSPFSVCSCWMSGQSLRTEPSPEEELGSIRSKFAAAPCWPDSVTAHETYFYISFQIILCLFFILAWSLCVRVWRPSCVACIVSDFLPSLGPLTVLDASRLPSRNEHRLWSSEYHSEKFLPFLLHFSYVNPYLIDLYAFLFPQRKTNGLEGLPVGKKQKEHYHGFISSLERSLISQNSLFTVCKSP